MKKMMMLAAMAMMAVTAQAVTVAWNDGKTVATVSGIEDNADSITVVATITVAEGATWGGDKGILMYNTSFHSNNGAGIVTYSEGFGFHTHGTHTNGSAWSGYDDSYTGLNLGVGTHKLEMYFTDYTHNGTNGWKIDCGYIDSNGVFQVEAVNNSMHFVTNEQLGLTNGSFTLTVGNINGFSVTDVAVATTVPEPTALALLALGVAGVALKRKMK